MRLSLGGCVLRGGEKCKFGVYVNTKINVKLPQLTCCVFFRILNKRGMSNSEVAGRVLGVSEEGEEEEGEGLYATYAMLHTIRKE